MRTHPAADSFPMMTDKRLEELVNDIKKVGQLEPITLCDGMILDGRNRWKACEKLGVHPKTREYTGDPWQFAWSLNGERRDLVDEQRYLIWKYCHENSTAWQNERDRITAEANRKRAVAAGARRDEHGRLTEAPVREQSVPVQVSAHPERKAKAEAAKVNAGAVARGDKLAKERPDLAEAVRKGSIKPAEAHRLMKKDEVKEKAASLPDGKFSVIYADPPWSYNDKQAGEISASYGGAEKHYPSMPLSDMKALPIPEMAAENCVLFLWATCPLLEDALELCAAWGFKYKAQFIWDKVRHNMGHYNSVRHEILLICTKGSATPQNVKLHDSVQSIEKTSKHSEKPEEFRAIIDELYPVGNRIELFRRGSAPAGWKVWGNEAQ